ncbi:sugar phosphate nucleotidyltransferase [Enterococcus cecorum]|uniref:sugar phosphate nucleotidyltransferase n=1 Tax=Enterococcus cecorum TaxID=44008 RepID=UPI00195B9485|nr:sugar phosphate nucleotidyltransferase [Enterococcus cecorum]MBM6935689.1 cupin domain-containing protein [Enterococcus cecorum]
MNIVLLSGGSGKRLWPLSNDIRSKQFIPIFRNEDGEYESMVQRVFNQVKAVDLDANITIATSKKQVSTIKHQLGDKVNVCVEPSRRDTFPAIALASVYLHDVQKVDLDEVVVVCPVDPYADEVYFKALTDLANVVETTDANLVLMGIQPTYPSEKYGYIIPESNEKISAVRTFKEKPSTEVAKQYIEQGALWNGGVFAFKLGYLYNLVCQQVDFDNYEDLFNHYDRLEKTSFDYAVVEKEPKITVMRFAGEWKDLGTWNTLTEAMDEQIIGHAMMDEKSENVHIINELNVPVLAMGVKDMVISASPEGIIVSDKERSSFIKPFVDQINQEVMFAEKSWGSYQVIDVDDESLTIKVTLFPNHRMNYHSHQERDEVWTVISGKGTVILDGKKQTITIGDVITMPRGCKHTVFAETELKMIEVQIGKDISVEDKIKYDLEQWEELDK